MIFNKLPELIENMLQKIETSDDRNEVQEAKQKLMRKLKNIMGDMTAAAKPSKENWSPHQIQKILSLRRKNEVIKHKPNKRIK